MSNLNKAYNKIYTCKSRISELADKKFFNDTLNKVVKMNSLLGELISDLKDINVYFINNDDEVIDCLFVVESKGRIKFSTLVKDVNKNNIETLELKELIKILGE